MHRIDKPTSIALRGSITAIPGLSMLLIAITLLLPATARGASQDLERLNRFVQTTTTTSNAAAIKVFRDGRDQIQEGEWEKAAGTFREFIRAYPSDKNVDAALYWLSLALMKQSRHQESVNSIKRLLSEYPQSSWKNDASALLIQIAAITGEREAVAEIEQELSRETENETMKIIALQSLFQSNPDRGAEYAADFLKPDSKAGRRLKENALTMLGQYRGKQSSAIFLDVARSNQDMKLRRSAIYWLGRTGDESVLNGLKDMALTSTEKEIARAAVGAIGQQSGARANEILVELARTAPNTDIRRAAVETLGMRSGEVIVDELMKVYNADQNPEIRKAVVHALSRRGNPSVKTRLLEIVRSNADVEVRRAAIHSIGRRTDESNVDDLSKIYDSETDEQIRRSVLSALSMTKGEQATAKIAEIARTADNVNVRLEAMHSLSRRDPKQTVDVLIQLYATEKHNEVRMAIISSLARLAPKPVAGQADQDAASRKIADIARNDPDPALREAALYAMVRRLGPGDQAVATVIQFYDAEKSEPMKERLISILGRSTNKAALRKLMEIAKSDASINLRKAAVSYLGRSKDPEAQKFIEEILK